MKLIKSKILIAAILIVIIAHLSQNVEARRKILRGRKVITRTYYREPAVPAWAVIIILAVAEMFIGGIAYVVMKKCIIDPPLNTPTYKQALSQP